MTSRFLLGAAILAAAAASAPAAAETQADRDLRTASGRLAKAERILVRARSYERPAAQLYAYEQAVALLDDVRRTAAHWSGPAFESVWDDAAGDLVRAYDAQAEICFRRGSLPAAKRHNRSALEIDPMDARARNLRVMILAAEETDIYERNQGSVAVDRIRSRRAAAGLPLRDRGVATRR